MNGGWIYMNSAVGKGGGEGGSVASRVGAVALAIPAYPCASAGRGKQEWWGGGEEGKTVMSFFGSWNGRRDWMYE